MRTSDSQTHALRCGWSCSEVDGVLQQLVGECCPLGRLEFPAGKGRPKRWFALNSAVDSRVWFGIFRHIPPSSFSKCNLMMRTNPSKSEESKTRRWTISAFTLQTTDIQCIYMSVKILYTTVGSEAYKSVKQKLHVIWQLPDVCRTPRSTLQLK